MTRIIRVCTAALNGIVGLPVTIEISARLGLQKLTFLGLGEAAQRELKVRVTQALSSCGYAIPDREFVIDLTSWTGSVNGLDLPVALGLIVSAGIFDESLLDGKLVVGELGLDGRCLPVNGALPCSLLAAQMDSITELMVPVGNAREASVVPGVRVIPVRSLSDTVLHLVGEREVSPVELWSITPRPDDVDMADIKGLRKAKRALEIAAAGGHNILMVGLPGSGKTMLARRLPTIQPPLTRKEMIETSTIYSVVGLTNVDRPLVASSPFRAPHHTVSGAGLVGGKRPSEVSLAHNGVLFLDELPEFKKHTLEMLRAPLTERSMSFFKDGSRTVFPANFLLVASMNPCPCGQPECTCTSAAIERYKNRIPETLLDHIDLYVDIAKATSDCRGESSAEVRERVVAARKVQEERFLKHSINMNSQMRTKEVLDCSGADDLAREMIGKLPRMSDCAFRRILKVARTIADLKGLDKIGVVHLMEAVTLTRPF